MKNSRKTSLIILIGVISFTLILFYLLLGRFTYNYDEYKEGKRLFGQFTLKGNKIYTFYGNHPLPEADVKSFHAISDNLYDSHIGIDKNNVYCGNLIIPKMNPKTVKPVGNNYYTDGKITYYCGLSTEKNKKLSWWKEIGQHFSHLFLNGEKPQIESYVIKALPQSNTPYSAILRHSVVTNGKQTYYKGKLMPNANPKSLHFISKSDVYFGDGKYVYYKNKRLPLSDNEGIYSMEESHFFNHNYLFNPHDGMFYVDDMPFDKKHAPYTLISKYDSHIYQALLLSKDGVYFYDTEKKAMQRAGDNPFVNGHFKEIAPLVFSDGKETLYVDAYKLWISISTRPSNSIYLDARCTVINHLDELEANKHWEKLGDNSSIIGSVWKHGKDIYFFSNIEESDIFSSRDYDDFRKENSLNNLEATENVLSTIYKIKDRETVNQLLNNTDLKPKDIGQLIDDEKLIVPKHTEIVQAKTHYEHGFLKIRRWLPIIGIIALLIIAIIEIILKGKDSLVLSTISMIYLLIASRFNKPHIKRVLFANHNDKLNIDVYCGNKQCGHILIAPYPIAPFSKGKNFQFFLHYYLIADLGRGHMPLYDVKLLYEDGSLIVRNLKNIHKTLFKVKCSKNDYNLIKAFIDKSKREHHIL